jgi:hypothetical protein
MSDLIRFSARLRLSGTARLNPRARRAFADMRDELEHDLAEYTLGQVRSSFHDHFRQPTGYYESHVHISNASSGLEVTDGGWAGPKYGPWLEGVGSRNQTTRFKGYHAFRNAAIKAQQRAEAMGYRLFEERYRRRVE